MKQKHLIQPILAILLLAVLISCKKDEYTIEDKVVTGNIAYVRTDFTPIQIDPVTQQPLSASISMDGTGNISDLGTLTMVSSFKFDLVNGVGSDFVTTYTGTSPSDSFSATGSSQRQPDGSIKSLETFSNGKGKFAKIKGGGETLVTLLPDGTSGSGVASWTVTY